MSSLCPPLPPLITYFTHPYFIIIIIVLTYFLFFGRRVMIRRPIISFSFLTIKLKWLSVILLCYYIPPPYVAQEKVWYFILGLG